MTQVFTGIMGWKGGNHRCFCPTGQFFASAIIDDFQYIARNDLSFISKNYCVPQDLQYFRFSVDFINE